jgi:hypothetical protein
MDVKTIFTKTAKGVTQVNQKTQSLSRDLMKVLKAIDGKSNVETLAGKVDFAVPALEKALAQLQKDAFIKIFEVKREEPMTDFGGEEDDFDFTAPGKLQKKVDFNATQGFKPSQYRPPAGFDQVERATAPAPSFTQAPTPRDIEMEAALAAAREKAQIEARAKAEREAQIRARLEVEAKAKREAEQRALEEAKRAQAAAEVARLDLEKKLAEEKKQRETLSDTRNRLTREQLQKETEHQQALVAARAKAEAEAQALATARAKAEAEAKALAEQRKQAEEAAIKQQQELDAAQRELRHQLKAEIEAKVRAEMAEKLSVDVEESGRAEVEAAVMEEARIQARQMLEDQLRTEREALTKAGEASKRDAEEVAKRMLAEQETRIRAEMEAQFAKIAEEKAKVEIEARRMAEVQAEAAAKAAAEMLARLKAEEEARKRAETEMHARIKSEEEARRRAEAEMEARIKSEAEARQRAEAEAAARKVADAAARMRLEARAREEAEERARVEAEMNAKLQAEKEAKIQAQAKAMIEAEMREKSDRENQLRIQAERMAREEAEAKVLEEAKAREAAARIAADEAAARERAQREADVRLAEERREAEERLAVERAAREKAEERSRAEEEAEARMRDAQVARLKELEEQRTQNEAMGIDPDEKKKKRYGKKKSGGGLRWLVVGVVALLAIAIGLIHVVPLGAVNTKLAKGLTEWMHDDVSTDGLNLRLFPRPYVRLNQLAVGKVQDAKAGSARLYMDIGTLFGDRFSIDTLEMDDVAISPEALARAVKWAQSEGRGKSVQIDRMVMRSIKIEVKGVAIDVFDADLKFDKAGKIVRGSARAKDGKWSVSFSPGKDAPATDGSAAPAGDVWAVEFNAHDLNLPIGAPVPISSLTAKGTMSGDTMTFPQVEAKLLEGSATGSVKVDWKAGVTVSSEFTADKIKVDQLTEVFTRDVSLAGRLEGQFTLQSSAPTVGELLDRPAVQGNFLVKEGAVGNIDLVQAMRSPGSVGGQSKFADLSGQLRVADGMIHYEKLKFAGGVLLANGAVSVNYATSALTGNVSSEIRSSVAQDRANFNVSGKVSRPSLKRG